MGSRKSCTVNPHSCCNREAQNVRRDWGFCVPITIIFKWFCMRRKVLFQEQFMISEQFMSIHFWTGNLFKTQVITGRPHLYAAKISPTDFLRLARAQHAFTDYMCCLQLCFDCTHCIPKVSCRRGLHRTCCSIGTSFWQGIRLHCHVCHTSHKSVSIQYSRNSLGLLSLQAATDSWHTLPLSQTQGEAGAPSALPNLWTFVNWKRKFHGEARSSCVWPWEVFFPFPFWLCASYQWLFVLSQFK